LITFHKIAKQLFSASTRSCQDLVDASHSLVTIDDNAVAQLATSLDAVAVRAAAHYTRPPINFSDVQEEVDYISMSSLLDFGSGFDPLLLAKGDRDACEAAEFATLGMAMQGTLPSAGDMAECSRWQISSIYGIDASEEREVMPGVTMTSPGPLAAYLAKIQEVLNTTGRILVGGGHASLGAWVLSELEGLKATNQAPSAAAFVERLAETFPAFHDVQEAADGLPRAVFHRKAQQLAAKLHARCAEKDDRFAFTDVAQLTVDSGDTVVAVLRERGVIKVAEALEKEIEEGKDLAGDARVGSLRAAAVEAVRRVCAKSSGQSVVTAQQFGASLVRTARQDEPRWKKLARHVDTATVAY